MNIAAYAKGLLTELDGSRRLGRDNADAVHAELKRVIGEAREIAVVERAALEPGDPIKPDYDRLIADIDAFNASEAAAESEKPAAKPAAAAKQTAAAATAPEKA